MINQIFYLLQIQEENKTDHQKDPQESVPPSPRHPELSRVCFLLLPLEVTLWSSGTMSRSRQGWRKWWAAHSQKPLVRKAGTDMTRRERQLPWAHSREQDISTDSYGTKKWKAIPLRGSLLLIKRHWSLLLSTERHIIQQHSNQICGTVKASLSCRRTIRVRIR